jgi:hypothetical protein
MYVSGYLSFGQGAASPFTCKTGIENGNQWAQGNILSWSQLKKEGHTMEYDEEEDQFELKHGEVSLTFEPHRMFA